MINTLTPTLTQSKYGRRKFVRDSGYAAIAAGTLCGITGFKQVKFAHKMKVHKCSAYVAAISSLIHWGAVKRWDKKLFPKLFPSTSARNS